MPPGSPEQLWPIGSAADRWRGGRRVSASQSECLNEVGKVSTILLYPGGGDLHGQQVLGAGYADAQVRGLEHDTLSGVGSRRDGPLHGVVEPVLGQSELVCDVSGGGSNLAGWGEHGIEARVVRAASKLRAIAAPPTR